MDTLGRAGCCDGGGAREHAAHPRRRRLLPDLLHVSVVVVLVGITPVEHAADAPGQHLRVNLGGVPLVVKVPVPRVHAAVQEPVVLKLRQRRGDDLPGEEARVHDLELAVVIRLAQVRGAEPGLPHHVAPPVDDVNPEVLQLAPRE